MYTRGSAVVLVLRSALRRPKPSIPSRAASNGDHLTLSSFVDTGTHLLSRDGAKDFKRMHQNGVLYTPALSSFPRSFMVYHELRSNPELAGFDAEEFIGGATSALPMVHHLMHNIDLDIAGAPVPGKSGDKDASVAAGSQHHPGSKRDNTVRLRELVSARLFKAISGSMALAASLSQSWRVEEITVKRAWLQAVGTFKEDEEIVADGSPARTVIRAAVGFETFESYAVELADAPEPLIQSRNSTHTWTFERALSTNDDLDLSDLSATATAAIQEAGEGKDREASSGSSSSISSSVNATDGGVEPSAGTKAAQAAKSSAAIESMASTYAEAVRNQDRDARDVHALLHGDFQAPSQEGKKKNGVETKARVEVVSLEVEKPMGLTIAEEIQEMTEADGKTKAEKEEEAKMDQEVETYLAHMAKEIEETVERPPSDRKRSPDESKHSQTLSVAVVHAVAAGSRAEGLVEVGDRLVTVRGEKVASFDAAMDALRQASSPVPVVFHRPIPETAVNKDAHFSIEEGGDKPRASASIRVEGEGAGGTGGTEEEDMEERPDANWRIVHIG